jgi:alcohol dehydrogenase (cytochrome c)
MSLVSRILLASLPLLPNLVMGQGGPLNPSDLLKPLGDSWPTFNGDYSGRRFSSLKQVDRSNVQHLTLGWMTHMNSGDQSAAASAGPMRGNREPVAEVVGGEGDGTINIRGGNIKASFLQVEGTLYVTMPDNGWAVDARSGQVLWHYFWKTKGGTHIGNRGFGMWKGNLYMETPDNFLVSLDAKTGRERWHKKIAELDEGYFSTMAPVVIGNHVIVGTGNDIDSPGFLQSFDPETGDLQWKHYNVPM